MAEGRGQLDLNCLALYSSEPEEVKWMVGTTDCSIKIPAKSTTFHAASFNSTAKSTLVELCTMYTKLGTEDHPSFLYSTSEKWQDELEYSRNVQKVLSHKNGSFYYNCRRKKQVWELEARKPEKETFQASGKSVCARDSWVCARCCPSRRKCLKADLPEVRHGRKLNVMHLAQLVASEQPETKPLQNKKITRSTKEKQTRMECSRVLSMEKGWFVTNEGH